MCSRTGYGYSIRHYLGRMMWLKFGLGSFGPLGYSGSVFVSNTFSFTLSGTSVGLLSKFSS